MAETIPQVYQPGAIRTRCATAAKDAGLTCIIPDGDITKTMTRLCTVFHPSNPAITVLFKYSAARHFVSVEFKGVTGNDPLLETSTMEFEETLYDDLLSFMRQFVGLIEVTTAVAE